MPVAQTHHPLQPAQSESLSEVDAQEVLKRQLVQLQSENAGLKLQLASHDHTQAQLQRSLQHFQAVVEHVDEGMVVIQNERIAYTNARAAEIAGMSVEEMQQVGFLQRVHPDDQALVLERQRKRLAGESVPSRYELRLLLPDGVVRWIGISVTLVPWDGSHGALVFFSDISQRRQLEEELRNASSEREAIFNTALVGISFNVQRRIQWANAKYEEMTGYTKAELVGQSTRLFYADDASFDLHGEETRQALVSDGVHVSERRLLRRNGETLWVQLAGRCVVDRQPDKGVIWTLLDITARHKAEVDTQAALAREKELNDLRSRFVAMTSHEFRTPLAAILSAAELLRDYSDRMPAHEKLELLGNIGIGVQRMTRMLDRILLIGQGDAHMLEFRPEALDLRALCQTMVDECVPLQQQARVTVHTQFEAPPASTRFDPKLLRHIVENLLSNAIKYSHPGGEVHFRIYQGNHATVFEVQDHGIGIPADEMPHLFDSFHRASNVGDIQGTGLGLAIVKKSVELHGGSIDVRCEPGVGTSFTVTLAV